MFKVTELKDEYQYYLLEDQAAKSAIKVVPERGGIITSFLANGEEVLFLDEATYKDPNANVRGGNPILFPICGEVENGEYTWGGQQFKLKNHGFARNLPWQVVGTEANGKAAITLKLTSNEKTKAMYPFDFELRFTYILKGNSLTIEQEYRNLSKEDMPFYAGFHPYYKVTDKSKLRYDIEGKSYINFGDPVVKKFRRDFDMTNEAVALMILDQPKNAIGFESLVTGRKIRYTYSPEFKYPVLWTAVGKDFVCFEVFTAKLNAMNTKEDLIAVKPGAAAKLFLKIDVEG